MGGVLARFYRPGGRGFELSFCPGVGNSPIEKIAQGGLSGLELTDTLHVLKEPSPYRVKQKKMSLRAENSA